MAINKVLKVLCKFSQKKAVFLCYEVKQSMKLVWNSSWFLEFCVLFLVCFFLIDCQVVKELVETQDEVKDWTEIYKYSFWDNSSFRVRFFKFTSFEVSKQPGWSTFYWCLRFCSYFRTRVSFIFRFFIFFRFSSRNFCPNPEIHF